MARRGKDSMADHLGNDSPALHGGASVSASGRRVRASAVQARKNVLNYQHQENMSLAELVASAAPPAAPARQRTARRPPARKRKQVSSEDESEVDDESLDEEEDDDFDGPIGRVAANGPSRSTRRQRHPKQQASDMIDLDEIMGSGDEEADYEQLAVPPPKAPGSGRGRGRGAGGVRSPRGRGRGRPKAQPRAPALPDDVLHGCPKCRYLRNGCGACRGKPAFTRHHNRWKPGEGRPQEGVEEAPTFHPTAEEFADPFAYFAKILPEASKYGIICVVPPPGFDPPFALEKGTNGLSMESFRFSVRTQFTSHLCCRKALKVPVDQACESFTRYGCHPAAAATPSAAKHGRGDLTPPDAIKDALQASEAAAEAPAPAPEAPAEPTANGDIAAPPAAAAAGGEAAAAPATGDAAAPTAAPAEGEGAEQKPNEEFGHGLLDKKLTLRSFAAYSDWAKSVHFSDPPPTGPQEEFAATRRPKSLPNQFPSGADPTVEEVEAEFWRIVETPDEVVETLYGQDLDSGHYGSGFPLPEWRRKLLARHLGKPGAPAELPPYGTDAEREYAAHPWNINNMPRCKDSVLRYYPIPDLITGVMVPWLYVGSALSAFCWHVEDHSLCSINYLHMGSPKVWYGVPPHGIKALEEAMRDALPHLFEAMPNLLHQLVTTMSPTELKKRGVPVYRIVHHPGSFVITMPDAYHAGFNCGFNVAEAVNFGPPAWLPHGYQVVEKYRAMHKAPTLSHDTLLTSLVCAVEHWPKPEPKEGEEPEPALPPAPVPSKAPIDGEIPYAEVPPQAVRLAAADLALRAQEERRRKAVATAAVGAIPERRMDLSAAPQSKDPATGVFANTADVDCARCKCDLWLSAVVSPAAPDVAVCPEHADVLVREHNCPSDSLALVYRYSPEELDGFVARAARRVEGTAEAVELAKTRAERWEAERARITPVGPMYDVARSGAVRAPGEPGPLPSSSEDEGGEPAKAAPASRKRPPPQPRTKEESETEFVDFEDEDEEEEEPMEEEDSEDEYRPSRGARAGSARGRGSKRGRRASGPPSAGRASGGRTSGRGGKPASPVAGRPPGAAAMPPPGAGRPLAGMPGMMPGPRVVSGGQMMPGGVRPPQVPGMLQQPVVVMTPQGPVLMTQPQVPGQHPQQINPAAMLAQLAPLMGAQAAALTPQQKAQQQQQALLLAHLAQQQAALAGLQQPGAAAAHMAAAAQMPMAPATAAMPAAAVQPAAAPTAPAVQQAVSVGPAVAPPQVAAPAPVSMPVALPAAPVTAAPPVASVAPVLPPAPALAVPPLQQPAPPQVSASLPITPAPAAPSAPAAAGAPPPASQPLAAPAPQAAAPAAPAAPAAAPASEAPAAHPPAEQPAAFDVASFLS